jgi:DNA-binding CsgD family transcriptional regulator
MHGMRTGNAARFFFPGYRGDQVYADAEGLCFPTAAEAEAYAQTVATELASERGWDGFWIAVIDAEGRELARVPVRPAPVRPSVQDPAIPKAVARLTAMERVVLDHVIEGLSSKEIARKLGISPRTVEFHRNNVRTKWGARNTAELIRIALMSNESRRAA